MYTNIKLKHDLSIVMPVDTSVEAGLKERVKDLEAMMISVWEDLHLALEQEVWIYTCIHLTNRFNFAVVYSVIDAQITQIKMVRTKKSPMKLNSVGPIVLLKHCDICTYI